MINILQALFTALLVIVLAGLCELLADGLDVSITLVAVVAAGIVLLIDLYVRR